MVVREMLARDLAENQSGFYLWATKKGMAWNRAQARHEEWQMVHIPAVMSELVLEAQRGNRTVRIMYRRDLVSDQVTSVQLV